ncbi:MAG: reverse transcriptase family protein [Chitinophagales bacterium]|nr:reverse transcriptase family protein [Chitinophagales bacterium]
MKKQTYQRHQKNKSIICSIRSITELCQLLKISKRKLELLAAQPSFKTFTVPKKDGGERLIEAPSKDLKIVLGRLNNYLQSAYYFEKSSAAYGFIVGVRNDEDRRNIFSNAKKHVNKEYLLNIDLKDFFHSVNRDQVLSIFEGPPFKFKRQLPNIIADLTTYKGRLPMGTPTSPVLSNFACRSMDEQLSQLAEEMLWNYSRYADDMSFSSNRYINEEMRRSILQIVKAEGFLPNPRKIKLFGPEEDKIVTGLLVNDDVHLAPDYLPRLKEDIEQLQSIFRAQNEQGQISTKWLEQYKQQVRGRLSFAGFVLRRNDEEYISLKDAYYVAINPPQEDFGAVSWRGFPYNI